MYLKNKTCCNLFQEVKKIYFWGAGSWLERFLSFVPDYVKICGIIDNDITKQGSIYSWKVDVPIISIDDFISSKEDDASLVLSLGMFNGIEVLKQLSLDKRFDNIDVYWSYFIILDSKKEWIPSMTEIFRLTEAPLIPKIIHYCWFGNSTMPAEFQSYIDGWKEKCPDYEIICWNEKNYDVSKNKYMKQAYEAKAWGFVPDYIRKDLIYTYGGIYLDTDVELLKPLDDLLYQDGFCGFEGNNINFGLGFGGRKGLPIMKELRDMYDNLEFVNKNSTEMITGPMYETEILTRHGLEKNGKYQKIAGLTVYPIEVLSGTNMYSDIPYVTKKTFTVHHYAGTWLDERFQKQKETLRMIYKKLNENIGAVVIDDSFNW